MLAVDIRRKRFPAVAGAAPREVLADLSLNVAAGEFVCLVGPSGCGKTTLLNLIAGLDRDYDGSIAIAAPGGAAPRVAYVFQEPRLLPWRTVADNLGLAMDAAGIDREGIPAWLQQMGLADTADVYPERLSTGMCRRVALARAFAVEPDLMLMDEPLVSLDHPTAAAIRELLLKVWRRHLATVLFVTHDLREAIQLADRILALGSRPARVLRDLAVTLPRELRGDESAVEDFRRQHFAPAAVRAEDRRLDAPGAPPGAEP